MMNALIYYFFNYFASYIRTQEGSIGELDETTVA